MNKTEINILTTILIEASFLLLFFKYNIISVILGIILGFILIGITKNIKKNNITKVILIILSIFLFILFFYKIINFISFNILKNYSLILICIPLIITSIYLGNKNYHTFIKTVEIVFYLIIIIKIMTIILCIPIIDFNNVGITININLDFIYIGIFILIIFKYLFYLTNYQISIKEIILCFINPLSIKLLSLMVLGNTLLNVYNYPYFNYLQTIKYFDFIERMEGTLSFEYLFCFMIILSFFIHSIKSLKKAI